jgi:TPR repeat protein
MKADFFAPVLFALGAAVSSFAATSAPADKAAMLAAEETYELRLERILNAKGRAALVEFLQRELRERPRPYVKAWLANYFLYGAELGLKDVADPARGYTLALESSQEGSLFGLELLGRATGDGRGVLRNPGQALNALRAAAEAGRATAMGELGKYYFFGVGTVADRDVGESWMRRSAQHGAYVGMLYLAEWWENARYVGTPNRAKANALYYGVGELGSGQARAELRERAKRGDRDAQKYVHLLFLDYALRGSDPLPAKLRESVKWLEENTAADDVHVQVALAAARLERTWPVYDAARAKARLQALAAAGVDDARYYLAQIQWFGIGEKADPAAAVAIWRELAEKGHRESLARLGWLHWWGNATKYGVPKDAAQAFEFSRRAADAGSSQGQLNTADCYTHGIGVEENYYLAAKYYGIAEDRGYVSARRMKDRVLAMVKD